MVECISPNWFALFLENMDIGIKHFDNREYDKALEIFEKIKVSFPHELSFLYVGMSKCLLAESDSDTQQKLLSYFNPAALYLYKRCKDICQEIDIQ